MQHASNSDVEMDTAGGESRGPQPVTPHERYGPARAAQMTVNYDSDVSPLRSQIGGGRKKCASSIPPGDYLTPSRFRNLLVATDRADQAAINAVARRSALLTPGGGTPTNAKKLRNPSTSTLPDPAPPPAPLEKTKRIRNPSAPPPTAPENTKKVRNPSSSNVLQPAGPRVPNNPKPRPVSVNPGTDSDDPPLHKTPRPCTPPQRPHSVFVNTGNGSVNHGPDVFNAPTPGPFPAGMLDEFTKADYSLSPVPPPSEPYPSSRASSPIAQTSHRASSASFSPTQKGGRISKATHDILEKGFVAINQVCAEIASATGFTEDRVAGLWNKHCGRAVKGFNYWNIYESYLAANLVDELRRSKFEVPDGIRWEEVTHAQRQICYKTFQGDYPDDKWEEILQYFDMSRKCERAVGTFTKRNTDFQKTSAQLTRLTDMWQSKFGFETVWVMCGNVPNEDTSLAAVYETTHAKEFFPVRCRATLDEVRGHLKSHVYDKVSRMAIACAWDEDVDQDLIPKKTSPRKSVAEPDVMAQPDVKPLVAHGGAPYKSRGTTKDVAFLKQQLVQAAAEAGLVIDLVQFPWKGLRELLAKSGYYVKNWPCGSRMPGEKGTEKGISGLKAQEQSAIFAALINLNLGEDMSFVKYEGNVRDLEDSKVPVVIGGLSTDGSRGRRLFVNGQIDNLGIKFPHNKKPMTSLPPAPAAKRSRAPKRRALSPTPSVTSEAPNSVLELSSDSRPIVRPKTVKFLTKTKAINVDSSVRNHM